MNDPQSHDPRKRLRKVRAPGNPDSPEWEKLREEFKPPPGAVPDVTEFLQEDPTREGMYRKKRSVRVEGRWTIRLMAFIGGNLVPLALAIIMSSLFLLIAISLSAKRDRSGEEAAPESPRIAEMEKFKSRHDMESANATMKAYFSAPTVKERARFVRHPEKVLPLMEDWYSRHPLKVQEGVKVVADSTNDLHGRNFLFLGVEYPDGKVGNVYLERNPGGYCVEWEATVTYQPVSWEDFLLEKPRNPVRFRLACEQDESISTNVLEGRGEVFFVKLKSHNEPGEAIAFCDNLSEDAVRLKDYLALKDNIGVLVDLVFFERREGRALFEITKLIQDGWIIDYDAEVAAD